MLNWKTLADWYFLQVYASSLIVVYTDASLTFESKQPNLQHAWWQIDTYNSTDRCYKNGNKRVHLSKCYIYIEYDDYIQHHAKNMKYLMFISTPVLVKWGCIQWIPQNGKGQNKLECVYNVVWCMSTVPLQVSHAITKHNNIICAAWFAEQFLIRR